MAIDAYTALKEFLLRLLGDRDAAARYAEDPEGELAAQGITDLDVSGVDIRQAVGEAAAGLPLSESARGALQTYSSGVPATTGYPSPPPLSAHPQPSEVVQHLNYVTYVTYEGDEHITQQLINYQDNSTTIDNSVTVDIDGDVHGDLDVETTNTTATGDGAVAAGDDIDNAATGDRSQIIDGDNHGQANTGDAAVQAGDDVDAPVNTGVNTGVLAGDDVTDTVVGDGNQVVNVDGEVDESVLHFGEGDVTNVGDASFDDAAVVVGGGAAGVVSDVSVGEGAAVSVGGDATGGFEEAYQDVDVEAYDSVVSTGQGPGDQQTTVDTTTDVEIEIELDGGDVPVM